MRGLREIRDNLDKIEGILRFIVSAQYLLSSSKLLNTLPKLSLKNFGVDISLSPDFPPQIIVAGPKKPQFVLLIENPHRFEQAISTGINDQIAIVVIFG